jgi:hypothetical protein
MVRFIIRSIFSILMAALLALPISAHGTLDSWVHSLKSSTSVDYQMVALLGVAAATVGGVVWYHLKKFTAPERARTLPESVQQTEDSVEDIHDPELQAAIRASLQEDRCLAQEHISEDDPIQFLVKPKMVNAITLKQIAVAQQSVQQGGAASCGYHALKNGIGFLRYLHGADTRAQLAHSLASAEYIHDLMGQSSHWRQSVVASRTKTVFSQFVYNELCSSIVSEQHAPSMWQRLYTFVKKCTLRSARETQAAPEHAPLESLIKKNKLIDIYKAGLKEYAHEITRAVLDDHQTVSVNKDSVIAAISKYITQQWDIGYPEYYVDSYYENKLYKRDEQAVQNNIKAYFVDARVLNKYIQSKNCTFSPAQIGQAFALNSTKSMQEGDWLSKEELQKLINDKAMMHKDMITVIEDINSVHELEAHTELAKAFERVRKGLKGADTSYAHLFIVGTMSRQQAQSQGHWFSIVVHRTAKGAIEMWIMDSLNKARLGSAVVTDLSTKIGYVIRSR